MVKRKIIWTEKANEERKEILDYWIQRNHSKTYSIKLDKLIRNTLKLSALYPETGRKTSYENVRVNIVKEYLIFYEFTETELVVLAIWDGRRDETTLKIK
ncbi:MAG TPA: type II toxin-antitoxin system RelE/ParE family toxin [Bacteroidales bacterium]|jgi:addiction module RelE/StbE family toxin|nr:type II toxin-antitoxin system RelE/ParE family toxin [Bacteroidales bacterium]